VALAGNGIGRGVDRPQDVEIEEAVVDRRHQGLWASGEGSQDHARRASGPEEMKPPGSRKETELIWMLVVNEEDVWSEASPFLRGTVMKAAEDLLLYPLMIDDHPVCPSCLLPLALVGFQGERGKPDFSRFRCPECGRSETFSDDNDHDGAP
jgi:hypothetical protein